MSSYDSPVQSKNIFALIRRFRFSKNDTRMAAINRGKKLKDSYIDVLAREKYEIQTRCFRRNESLISEENKGDTYFKKKGTKYQQR